MAEPSRPNDYWTAPRVVGIIYLTCASALGGGVFWFWHPQSHFAPIPCGVSAAAGLVAALIAGIPDPAARPIRWGLLWLALGLVVGTGTACGVDYLYLKAWGLW